MALIALPQLAAKIRSEYCCAPSYQRIWQAAADGRLPGVIRIGNRLFIEDAKVPDVAAMFAAVLVAPRNAA